MSVTITSEALTGLSDFFRSMGAVSNQAASLAINQVVQRSGMKRLQDSIYGQVAFPKGYLDLPDRLGATKFATAGDLEAIIRARHRATSLARFLAPGQTLGTSRVSGVRVTVRPGVTQTLKRAFLIQLNQGSVNTETQNNMGLAVRLAKGETLRGGKGVRIGGNNKSDLYLLYGPSVDQVFTHVADEQSEPIAEDVATEFMRQFTRLNGA